MAEYNVLVKLREAFENDKPARAIEFNEEEEKIVRNLFLLTRKPVLYVANVSEEDVSSPDDNKYVQQVREFAAVKTLKLSWFVRVPKRKLLSLKTKIN